jgi:hypothetical protein
MKQRCYVWFLIQQKIYINSFFYSLI